MVVCWNAGAVAAAVAAVAATPGGGGCRSAATAGERDPTGGYGGTPRSSSLRDSVLCGKGGNINGTYRDVKG